MENLTHQQIEAVIHWMETWEQLKDTAIPIRFKEDFTKQLQQADVSGRSELLRAYFTWHKEQRFVSHKDSDIDEFLASNSH